ncbi:hypothetical protein IHQ68_02575 [Chelatococcus sambhunathii]|uniref:Uncharacterized protein n=1 Tax=Chelatococcus sambhunathii TaxID=363953 RepID=A0ABU1DBL6_9HYPH|nr:hypothetical protein [Chelatococcus sambhunathii]MDR4305508.1 hypothetical protein [Chelatococcus sambhunathii]
MPFENFWAYVATSPGEAALGLITLTGALSTVVGFVAGGAWWAASALAKSRLETLEERMRLAQDKEKDLIAKAESLRMELAKIPGNSAQKSVAEYSQARAELEAAKDQVSDAYAGLESVVGGLWNAVTSMIGQERRREETAGAGEFEAPRPTT